MLPVEAFGMCAAKGRAALWFFPWRKSSSYAILARRQSRSANEQLTIPDEPASLSKGLPLMAQ
jgi:hypothetical protein